MMEETSSGVSKSERVVRGISVTIEVGSAIRCQYSRAPSGLNFLNSSTLITATATSASQVLTATLGKLTTAPILLKELQAPGESGEFVPTHSHGLQQRLRSVRGPGLSTRRQSAQMQGLMKQFSRGMPGMGKGGLGALRGLGGGLPSLPGLGGGGLEGM